MAPKLPPSLEDTISLYRNKYLIELEDENDDALLLDSIADDQSSHSSDDDGPDLRADREEDEGNSKRSTRGRKSRLPRDLSGLMGQANVSFARGEHTDAILMCQEVIRLAPRCADPFISLAEYYHDSEEEEKAEQLYLIAAYLQPSNADLWVRVAESATRRREFRLATTAYTKAIRANKNESSILYHLRRCNLYEKLGDQRKALRGYENLISVLGPDDEKFGLELARGIARIYLTEDKLDNCIRTLEGALDKYSNQLTGEDLAQLCHCYNRREKFIKTIDVMVKKCSVKLFFNKDEEWNVDTLSRNIEKKLHVPITIKISELNDNRFSFSNRCHLAVALISLGYHDETVKPLVAEFKAILSPEDRQSLYDIAKAYYNQEAYKKAKEILLKLTSRRDSQAAYVWLLYSQCLKNLNEIEEAIEGYKKVLTYDSDDYSSRLALSNLLSVQGRFDEALEVTKQPLFSEKPVDIPLLYQSCQLLEQAERWDDYCESAKALILTDMIYTKQPKEIMSMITSKSHRTRLDNLRAVQREIGQDPLANRQRSIGTKLDSSTLLKTFLRYIEILFHIQKDYRELKRICFSAYTCSAFECYESSIDYYTALACIRSGDKEFTYNHLKLLASRNSENNQLWNLLSLAMGTIYQDLRHGRFCLRQFSKNPEVLSLALFNGHNALMSGSYKHALGEYMSVFKEKPNDPFVAFCLALTYLSLSCQKYVSSKYLCIFQMIAFLHTYLELRGSCQEAMYNIGRVFHQMNMLDKAVIFYKKALLMDDKPRITRLQESPDEFEEIFDVRREAAFNLALIYKNSQSPKLAYRVIQENFTI